MSYTVSSVLKPGRYMHSTTALTLGIQGLISRSCLWLAKATQYSSCRVSYVDPTGKCIEGIAKVEDYKADAKNNQQLEITAKVSDKAEAKALAEKLLRKHNRYAKTASFTLPGNPDLVAGVAVGGLQRYARLVAERFQELNIAGLDLLHAGVKRV